MSSRRALVLMLLPLALFGCSIGKDAKPTASKAAKHSSSDKAKSQKVSAKSSIDPTKPAFNPCDVWTGAFGFFDPQTKDGKGVLAKEAYAKLCVSGKPTAKDKASFCTSLAKEAPKETELHSVLCANTICEGLHKRLCSAGESEQGLWTKDYMKNHGCSAIDETCP